MKILVTAKTRSLLREFKNGYKKLGKSVHCNQASKSKNQKWVLFSGEKPIASKRKIKRFNVVNGQAVAV